MAHLQNKDATLKTSAEQSDATFAIFATPKQESIPVKADNLYQARSAPLDAAGQVIFTAGLPFESPAGVAVKLEEIKPPSTDELGQPGSHAGRKSSGGNPAVMDAFA